MKYAAVLEPQEEGGFTVRCIEIPGATGQGEALANTKEAIELVLDVQREEPHRKTDWHPQTSRD
ncbi:MULTISPECIES: type II toxin-antitoxin system HicB family antitoxin [unclassified Methanoculleus]|uniref:type II toxin-antitoxin system HicB family antitoxin n=1 Tax=unclassified Methanoculleus TaxID=2619537 RepID=UPI0025DE488A|nr:MULTISPECIES: type II toxin-antitoxin system HicB family antitoxin [unclassified Methanoculleus]MCK9319433.1 type II toxin-antitoxin system HicB family antitoxin [Methanoculleus sp.]MDD2254059.1 type II toxin-antitoxin system HicB family antitoxin [Methanoculleus sp.]MDD2788482.1 type II toxin-antitoxin system HicB family antitoxin [Methanoculleus sp.]MDD3216436.1 type II toxin-antitoxin system HicB family antitoxin [Methanoculleus sp.]MDD4313368.1 type II toxin-antitoxin system HicB family